MLCLLSVLDAKDATVSNDLFTSGDHSRKPLMCSYIRVRLLWDTVLIARMVQGQDVQACAH